METYLSRLNRDELAEVLLMLEPRKLDALCKTDEYIQSVCQNVDFKERYESKWYRSVRETRNIFNSMYQVGVLGDEALFWDIFNSIGRPYDKLIVLRRAIEGASELGSPKFALKLIQIMQDYINSDEIQKGPPLRNERETLAEFGEIQLTFAKQYVILNLSQRGDIDSAFALADKWGISAEWVLAGQITGGNKDFNNLAIEWGIDLNDPRIMHNILERLLKTDSEFETNLMSISGRNELDILWPFLEKYPELAQQAFNKAIDNNNFTAFMEIRRLYPVHITGQNLISAISHEDVDLFNTLVSLFTGGLTMEQVIRMFEKGIRNPDILNILLNRFDTYLYEVLKYFIE